MSIVFALRTTLVAAALGSALSAGAAVITLDFEGIGSQASINNFYNGGTDSQGNSGVNYGVAFGSNALGFRESDPAANFALPPSAETIMFFLTGTAVLNYAPGFDTGFSFWYTTTGFTGSVQVYDGLDATGNLLGSISLAALGAGPVPGDPFSNWAIGSLEFNGMARSVNFGGTVNQVGYDNITFGSTNPVTPPVGVPEPGSLALVGIAMAALVAGVRRRKA
jgi:PEP-CTERM motif